MYSIVIPVFNEGDIIVELLTAIEGVLRTINDDYEVIVVNDGSSDDTHINVSSYAEGNPRVRQISYCRNLGKGYALKTGFKNAKTEFVVFLDGDFEIGPDQLVPIINALTDSDIVIASKWHEGSQVSIPFSRRFLSKVFNLLVRAFTGLKYKDSQVGLKAMRRMKVERIIERSIIDRFAFDVEFLVLANHLNLNVTEVPVQVDIRKQFSVMALFQMFIDIIKIGWKY